VPVSEETYKRVALEADDETWELHCGRLVAKPAMSYPHNSLSFETAYRLRQQLEGLPFHVRANAGRARIDDSRYFVPDVLVLTDAQLVEQRQHPNDLETFAGPLPLVVEVWSRSTGAYDVAEKLPHYMARGDLEVWRLHPYDRTLTAWRRQEDGEYTVHEFRRGKVRLHAIPAVTIDLDQLWATLD
jgi:Uma2 family endonuclease